MSISTGSLVLTWDSAANPGRTEYYAEISTVPGRDPTLASSGWLAQTSFTFTGLAPGTTFYGQVKARNQAGVETAFTDLGAAKTLEEDVLPPRTALLAGSPSFGTIPLFVTAVTTFSLPAVDDLRVAGDAQGVGVDRSFVAVDSDAFHVASGTFSLKWSLEHTVRFSAWTWSAIRNRSRPGRWRWTAPPVTRLDSSQEPSWTRAAARSTRQTAFGLSAVDPPSTSAASGVALTEFRVNAGTWRSLRLSFPRSPGRGAHLVEFRSADNLGNLELTRSATALIDATAPLRR